MGDFRPLKARQVWRIVLETRGPRSKKDQKAFREALLKVIREHRTTVLGWRKPKSKRKATRRRSEAR